MRGLVLLAALLGCEPSARPDPDAVFFVGPRPDATPEAGLTDTGAVDAETADAGDAGDAGGDGLTDCADPDCALVCAQ